MELYLNTKDYSISDQNGKKYSVEEAREVTENNELDNCNLAFERLALNNFDIEKLKKYYKAVSS